MGTAALLSVLALAVPAQAITILSNLPGTSSGTGTDLGLGTDLIDRTKAVGLTVGANSLSFTSITGLFGNPDNAARNVTGGIFSDVAGNPGAQLIAFNAAPIAAGAFSVLETLTAVGAFVLSANTSYWFVLDGPAFANGLFWETLAPNTAPTPSVQVSSFDGYRLSLNGGLAWGGSGLFNGVEIEASLVNVVPEPGTLLLFGVGLAGLGFARCRKRHSSDQGDQPSGRGRT